MWKSVMPFVMSTALLSVICCISDVFLLLFNLTPLNMYYHSGLCLLSLCYIKELKG